MLTVGTILKHYKRPEIQREIIRSSKDREVGLRFKEGGFGKRPDILVNPSDILEGAKQGVSSFHISEERWRNPMHLSTGLKKRELDELRYGWDLVLDVDSPIWEYSKLITHLLIQALYKHNIKSVSCKFSGNKGFHIGVPYEVLPKQFSDGGKECSTAEYFPDLPKKIALYLMEYIDGHHNHFELSTKIIEKSSINIVAANLGKKTAEISQYACLDCGQKFPYQEEKETKKTLVCPYCQKPLDLTSPDFIQCPSCKTIISNKEVQHLLGKSSITEKGKQCKRCGSRKLTVVLSPEAIIDVDTVLIASRHLYRSVYSLHEKSGLASIPLTPTAILLFEKEQAHPEKIKEVLPFMLKEKPTPEAHELFTKALQWWNQKEREKTEKEKFDNTIFSAEKKGTDFQEIQEKAPQELFPPCIKLILLGLDDGKKRALFILLNFLTNVGWDYESIEQLLLEWNKRNKEPLRETIIRGHIRYHKQNKKKVLPPNCDNPSYYKDLRVCCPDAMCAKIKNPVNYTRRRILGSQKKTTKKQPNQ